MSPDASSGVGEPLEAVLFDLDGTLLDTAADIAVALNRTLAEHGWAPLRRERRAPHDRPRLADA